MRLSQFALSYGFAGQLMLATMAYLSNGSAYSGLTEGHALKLYVRCGGRSLHLTSRGGRIVVRDRCSNRANSCA